MWPFCVPSNSLQRKKNLTCRDSVLLDRILKLQWFSSKPLSYLICMSLKIIRWVLEKRNSHRHGVTLYNSAKEGDSNHKCDVFLIPLCIQLLHDSSRACYRFRKSWWCYVLEMLKIFSPFLVHDKHRCRRFSTWVGLKLHIVVSTLLAFWHCWGILESIS